MARGFLDPFLNRRLIVPLSTGLTLTLGLLFIFVRAPHPWGWYGIDQYHQLALELAQGRPFSTMDVPWGYAYFLALFYRVFGPRPVFPLIAQAVLNALVPALVYRYATRSFDSHVAALAALATAILSFNTVYASTESSDSICTVLFMIVVVLFAAARHSGWPRLILSGALCGLAAQFRPNLILLPVVLAALQVARRPRGWRRLGESVVLVGAAGAMLAPWTVRNLRLTGDVIPTSTHGGVQLWYGTLQVGPYLDSRAHNPRSFFEAPTFEYTSLVDVPIIVETQTLQCAPTIPHAVELVYWTDIDRRSRRVPLSMERNGHYRGEIPAQPGSRALYYFFSLRWPAPPAERLEQTTPPGGPTDPLLYFLSRDHLGDLDLHDDLLDAFDLVRLLRHIAWQEPLRAAAKLDRDNSGELDRADLHAVVQSLLLDPGANHTRDSPTLAEIVRGPQTVEARFTDGSRLLVPREWRGTITEVEVGEGAASNLLHRRRRFATLAEPAGACLGVENISLNGVFYRMQPHEMRRYTALAWDNIRRTPGAYAWSILYRAVRLFVVRGTQDRDTTQQFGGSPRVYGLASVASVTLFALFVVGVVLSIRRGYALGLPLTLIGYVPATLAFVLTNMRYTVTIQPLIFVFVAVSLLRLLESCGAIAPEPREAAAAPNRAGSQRAPRL